MFNFLHYAVVLFIVSKRLQAVQFSFNRADVAISEGGDLSSQISILKSGENNETISFQVRVISDTARENQDYISNSETPYVFTSNTSQLSIRTQLVGDRAGEPIETFMICLPDAQVLQSMGAQAVQPTCVTITIVDDDSVVIGFKNSRERVVEGGTTMVCAVVKPEGLRLDPFDRVPLNIRTNPASSEVQLNTNSLVFEQSISERCVMVTVQNGDFTDMGNRSYTLILERSNEMSTIPVEIYPNIIPIFVIDDDAQESNISFTIISQESPVRVLEGSRVGGIEVQKLGSTVLTYNVTLTSSARSNDFVVTSPLKFDPTTTRMNVEVDIMEDSISETRKEFSISIDRIMVIGAQEATNLATATGEPVTIIAYDNDIEINFTSNEFSVPEDSSNKNVCVEITKPVASSDIEPSLAIPITVTLENSVPNNLLLDQRKILLNATNKMACLTVSHTANNSSTRRYSIQLMWTDDQAGYNVYLPRQNATIIIIITDTSVVIGFNNSRKEVVEGEATMVCAEVKPEGLRLDPFDHVPLIILTNPASNDSEVQLNTNSLVFEQLIDERCVMVTVPNVDNVNTGNRSYNLILEKSSEPSTVPVEIYPNTVSILVIDDDAQVHPNTEAPTAPATKEATAAQSAVIHGITTLITSLIFTEVAMLFF